MKLAYPEIETVFRFGEGSFPSAVIENPGLFYRLVNDLYGQSIGGSGDAVLSINDEPISIGGNLELFTNFFPFEINQKNLINKIIAKLEKQALSPEFYERTQHLLGETERLILDIAFHHDLDLETSRLSISTLFKAAGICLKEDGLSLAEKISSYMDLMIANGLANVFVLVNLRSVLDSRTMEIFTDNCCRHDQNILLIDNHAYDKLSREKRVIIDMDLCEF